MRKFVRFGDLRGGVPSGGEPRSSPNRTHFRFTKRVQLVVGFRNQKKNRSSVFLEMVPKSDPLGTIVLRSGFSRFQRFTGSYFGIGTKT